MFKNYFENAADVRAIEALETDLDTIEQGLVKAQAEKRNYDINLLATQGAKLLNTLTTTCLHLYNNCSASA